jgi:putative methyltransferase (TIGR04325 family)
LNSAILKFIKLLVPPLVYMVGGNLRQFHRIRVPVPFSGVQDTSMRLPPIEVDAWTSDNWLSYQGNTATEESVANYYSHESALKLLCSQLGDVDIFDLGGGPAVLYPVAKAASSKLNYVVLENEKICEVGRKIFPEVRFFSDASDAINTLRGGGIALCVSVLQYCFEWESTLDLLIYGKPRFVMIGRHCTPPDGKTLYAVQTIHVKTGYCGQAHIMFLPKDALVRAMSLRRYELLVDLPLNDMSWSLRGEDKAKLPVLLTRNFVFVERK